MSNETCTVTIADIYGAEWWDRNKAELDREWEWGFRLSEDRDHCLAVGWGGIKGLTAGIYEPHGLTRIILHRRKPKPPTLREVYGVDEVTIPAGWEWTGEWRVPGRDDYFQSGGGGTCAPYVHRYNQLTWENHRLILRERQKKVWFKAEESHRHAKAGDWFWSEERSCWKVADTDFVKLRVLCATRHEEIDQTVQVVTQAMVDGVGQV